MRSAETDREPVPIPFPTPAPASSPDARVRILVVDDHPIVRQGITRLINDEPDLIVCGEAESAAEALALAERLRPRLVVVDISLGGADGLEVLKGIRDHLPGVVAIVMSMHDESLYGERAIRAGAMGYVHKHEAPDVLIKAIRRVLGGEVHVSESLAATLLQRVSCRRNNEEERGPLERLSNRELQVFRLIGDGMTVRDIAGKLLLSAKTIETHRAHIKEKLSVRTSSNLLRYAVQYGVETA